jgi:hypothetical protein
MSLSTLSNSHRPLEALAPVLVPLRALRQGFYYGAKVRFIFAVCNTVAFRYHLPLSESLEWTLQCTAEHGWILGSFAALYKFLVWLQRKLLGRKHPSQPFVGGFISAYFTFGRRSSSIRTQVLLYITARVLQGLLSKARGSPSRVNRGRFYRLWQSLAWGSVMVLFEYNRMHLQDSLVSSMEFIYDDAERWSSWRDFVPFKIPDLLGEDAAAAMSAMPRGLSRRMSQPVLKRAVTTG